MYIRSLALSCLTAGLVTSTACTMNAGDDGSDPARAPITNETTQPINWLTVGSWGTPGNAGPDLDIGPSNDRTCFLTGVVGSLKAYPGPYQSPAFGPDTRASAGVYEVEGRWKVETRAGNGPGVAAQVACIAYAANRTWLGVLESPNSLTATWVPATPNRQCA